MTDWQLPALRYAEDYLSLLDGLSVEGFQGLEKRMLTRGLVKSYILETVGEGAAFGERDLVPDVSYHPLEDQGFGVLRLNGEIVSFVETRDHRFPILHLVLDAQDADRLVSRLVGSVHWLDSAWLAAPFLESLWAWVVDSWPQYRYSRLSFEHEALYERVPEDSDEGASAEIRTSRFTMVDRLEDIQVSLPQLQDIYRPLHSLSHVRVPGSSRGGSDFYFNGKSTNRTDSFAQHRNHVLYVKDVYSRLVSAIERLTWTSWSDGALKLGSPVILEFSRELDSETLGYWVDSTFIRNNRFRMAGSPIWVGDHKVHIYGIDRHLWQPITIEVTPNHVVLLLDEGTCGNTVNRLLTNVQRYLDPAVTAWIGSEPYGDLITSAVNPSSTS